MRFSTSPVTDVFRRDWQEQPLPAHLISYEQAETVAVGLRRREARTRAVVGLSRELVRQTLEEAGVATTLVVLHGGDELLASVILETDADGAERFDELHAAVLCDPQPGDVAAATWLRQRRLAHLRELALGGEDRAVFLPELDYGWHPQVSQPVAVPKRAAWLLQGLPLLALAFGLLVCYIYNAGQPSLLPLLLIPLAGSLAFGILLFFQLRGYRQTVAQAWLARPARLRPESATVAARLARSPWSLLVLPPVLLIAAFAAVVLLLAQSGQHPTLGIMLWPIGGAMGVQLLLAAYLMRRYVATTRTLIQGLPSSLLPANRESLWQSFLYY